MNNVDKYSFGIDLGTTNSCISYLGPRATTPNIIEFEEPCTGKTVATLPSCVMLNDDGTLTVGKVAYMNRYKPSAIYSVKRMMGSDSLITLTADSGMSKTFTPTEISSFILAELKHLAEKVFGEGTVRDVTITVPAHFNDHQRRATQEAGKLAGLNVIGIINEPTSAGLLYGLDEENKNETILVYDLGGGTFDVSVLRVTKELRPFPAIGVNLNGEYNNTAINIVANEGDVHLGGDDVDNNLVNFAIKELSKRASLTTDEIRSKLGTEGIEKLKLDVENAKKSSAQAIEVEVDEQVYKAYLTGIEMEEECYRPIYERTKTLVLNAMAEADVSYVNHIVLVGGSTKSEVIRRMLREDFKTCPILHTFEPDLSVALGASVSSAITRGNRDLMAFVDVVPRSLGVQISEGGKPLYVKLLKVNTQLPCSATETYTISDPTKPVHIKVYQGEDTKDFNKLVPIGNLTLTPDMFSGRSAKVTFTCDVNGRLSCSTKIGETTFNINIDYYANKTQTASVDDLSRGEKKFYRDGVKALNKLGASKEIMNKWNPGIVKENGIKGSIPILEKLKEEAGV